MDAVTILLIVISLLLGFLIYFVNALKESINNMLIQGISETNSFEISDEDFQKIVTMIMDEVEKRKRKKSTKKKEQ